MWSHVRKLVNNNREEGGIPVPFAGTGISLRVGAKGRARTADRTIFSRELYQLSYLGAGDACAQDDCGAGWAIEDSNL